MGIEELAQMPLFLILSHLGTFQKAEQNFQANESSPKESRQRNLDQKPTDASVRGN